MCSKQNKYTYLESILFQTVKLMVINGCTNEKTIMGKFWNFFSNEFIVIKSIYFSDDSTAICPRTRGHTLHFYGNVNHSIFNRKRHVPWFTFFAWKSNKEKPNKNRLFDLFKVLFYSFGLFCLVQRKFIVSSYNKII